jgi:hypothetical protein
MIMEELNILRIKDNTWTCKKKNVGEYEQTR